MRTLNKKGYLVLGILIGVVGMSVISRVQQDHIRKENQMVHEYVACLQDNYTQRSYCAKEVGSNYYYMDQLVEKYGYEYTQVGYDLYIDYKGGDK